MCRAKCAAITVRASIMEFLRVTDAPDFSNVPFDDRVTMCAKRKPKENVWSTKLIGINVVLVACENASKSAWTKMRFSMNVDHAIQRYADKWQCSWTKTWLAAKMLNRCNKKWFYVRYRCDRLRCHRTFWTYRYEIDLLLSRPCIHRQWWLTFHLSLHRRTHNSNGFPKRRPNCC